MASLTRSVLNIAGFCGAALLLTIAGVMAQGGVADPVPTWPADGRIPRQYSDRYVFLTSDKHTVVVLAPERSEDVMTGPKKAVRVPLWNNLVPSITVSVALISGAIKYEYIISNAKEAQDPIGKFAPVLPASLSELKVHHFPTNGKAAWAGAIAHNPIAPQAIL